MQRLNSSHRPGGLIHGIYASRSGPCPDGDTSCSTTTGGYCPDDRYRPLFRVLKHYRGSELVWADFESKSGVIY